MSPLGCFLTFSLKRAEMDGRDKERRVLQLAVVDAVPIPLTFKYTFELGELDVDRLRLALDTLLDGEFWPLRGVLHSLSIVVEEPFPNPLEISERPDLFLADIQQDASLTDALVYASLLDHCPVLKIRLTKLADGVLLGFNISHAYADAHTFFRLFFPSLAAQYSGINFSVKILNDRSSFTPVIPPIEHHPSHSSDWSAGSTLHCRALK